MVWLQPTSLWLAVLVAVPIAIHLLRTRRARRLAFPSVRFVRPSQTASVRLHAPSDLLLLALRVAIVLLAALACAQPLWITPAREASWNARTARAIVVDTSESMRDPSALEPVQRIVARESEAFVTRTFEVATLGSGIERAVAWLQQAPPARREIVVVSDFQLGSMSDAIAGMIPSSVGLRFERVARSNALVVPPVRRLTTADAAAEAYAIGLTDRGTTIEVQRRQSVESPGFRLLGNAGDENMAAAVRRALVAAGTAAPDPSRRIAVRTGTAISDGEVSAVAGRWMIEIIGGLSRDAELDRLARSITEAVPRAEPWTIVVRGQSNQPVVRAAASDAELVLDCATPLESYFTAAVARAALRVAPWSRPVTESDPSTIPDSTLDTLRREPGPADTTSWQTVEHSDGRWFWAALLLLLAVEAWLRNRTAEIKEVHRAAA